MGLIGIWIAMATDECFRGLAFIVRFKQEKMETETKCRSIKQPPKVRHKKSSLGGLIIKQKEVTIFQVTSFYLPHFYFLITFVAFNIARSATPTSAKTASHIFA